MAEEALAVESPTEEESIPQPEKESKPEPETESETGSQSASTPLRKKTPSISLAGIKQKIDEPEVEEKPVEETITEENDYDEKTLRNLVSKFANELRDSNKSNQFNILNREYRVEDHVILISLDNPVQMSILEEFRNDLIQHLRSTLKNRRISLKAELVKAEEKKMIYTQREKFDHLAEKQPLLKDLKEKLGLDPDF